MEWNVPSLDPVGKGARGQRGKRVDLLKSNARKTFRPAKLGPVGTEGRWTTREKDPSHRMFPPSGPD